MRESAFQRRVILRIKSLFPDCFVIKNDPSYVQGVPDYIILFQDRWAMLEFKQSPRAKVQPNQAYWVEQLNDMSFAAFVDPENVEDVLYALQRSFGFIR